MTVARHKGDKGLCDILFSRIVRSRGECQYPGGDHKGILETAHLIGRSSSGTRCIVDNAACLCSKHHRLIDGWWDEKALVVEATIGEERYRELKEIAGQHKFQPFTSVVFWAGELDRLKARCRELGLSDRRAA
jgi:hypothetical protein